MAKPFWASGWAVVGCGGEGDVDGEGWGDGLALAAALDALEGKEGAVELAVELGLVTGKGQGLVAVGQGGAVLIGQKVPGLVFALLPALDGQG